MIKNALLAYRFLTPSAHKFVNSPNILSNVCNRFSTINLKSFSIPNIRIGSGQPLVNEKRILDVSNNSSFTQIRTVIKFDRTVGKRKTVKAVLTKFYRLDWGGWIRTRAGRNKRKWRKSYANQRRARQHVLCNATQSTMLDKMVRSWWRKPKYYIDDPYEPYHRREEFWITRTKPRENY